MQKDLLDWEILCLLIMNITDQSLADDEKKAGLRVESKIELVKVVVYTFTFSCDYNQLNKSYDDSVKL